jgi:pimeloyl-ACP methyl ester carboxylesterase
MEPDSSAMVEVEVEDVQIVCRRIGKGPPLLLLNGFAATSADWDPGFVDRLASRHELILLNNRGIGGSTDDGQSFDIAKLAADAANVIDTLGFERTSVMGWSMGGFIAQTLAIEYPDRVH